MNRAAPGARASITDNAINHAVASVSTVERLIPGQSVRLIAAAWEVPPTSIKQTDGLRVSAWVSLGVNRLRLVAAVRSAQLDALR